MQTLASCTISGHSRVPALPRHAQSPTLLSHALLRSLSIPAAGSPAPKGKPFGAASVAHRRQAKFSGVLVRLVHLPDVFK